MILYDIIKLKRCDLLKYSEIYVQHIYNVIFDDVRECEFNGKHLALVLKSNNDKKTFIVMPLTSEPNGNGKNKEKIGKIKTLPISLRNNDTYAVFNQIRTVNANRFISLKEGTNNNAKVKIDDALFIKLFNLAITDITYNLEQDKKISLLKNLYEKECIIKAKKLAYDIIRLKKINSEESEINSEINRIKLQIKDIIDNIPYNLSQIDIDNRIKDIFENVQ